jgi:hypothetical protein
MGKILIVSLFTAGFAVGAAYVTAFELIPARTACADRSCRLLIADG